MNIYSTRIAAIRISQSIEGLKRYFIRRNHFRRREITFCRKELIKLEDRKLNMRLHVEKPYEHSSNFWIYYLSFLSFSFSLFLGIIMNDQDVRYFLYTRFPYNMKIFDDVCTVIHKKWQYFDENFLFFLKKGETLTPDEFNKTVRKIKNALFNTEKRKEEEKQQLTILNKEAQKHDETLDKIDQILKENDEKLFKNP